MTISVTLNVDTPDDLRKMADFLDGHAASAAAVSATAAADALPVAPAGNPGEGNISPAPTHMPALEPQASAADPAPAADTTEWANLDKAGTPWDSRIHAKTKTKKADGTWKKGRGIDDAEVKRIEQELRDALAGQSAPEPQAPAAPAAAPPPPPAANADAQPVANPGPPPGHQMPGQPAPEPQAPAAAPPPPPASDPEPEPELIDFCTFLDRTMAANITQAAMQPVFDKHGVASLPALAAAAPETVDACAREILG